MWQMGQQLDCRLHQIHHRCRCLSNLGEKWKIVPVQLLLFAESTRNTVKWFEGASERFRTALDNAKQRRRGWVIPGSKKLWILHIPQCILTKNFSTVAPEGSWYHPRPLLGKSRDNGRTITRRWMMAFLLWGYSMSANHSSTASSIWSIDISICFYFKPDGK